MVDFTKKYRKIGLPKRIMATMIVLVVCMTMISMLPVAKAQADYGTYYEEYNVTSPKSYRILAPYEGHDFDLILNQSRAYTANQYATDYWMVKTTYQYTAQYGYSISDLVRSVGTVDMTASQREGYNIQSAKITVHVGPAYYYNAPFYFVTCDGGSSGMLTNFNPNEILSLPKNERQTLWDHPSSSFYEEISLDTNMIEQKVGSVWYIGMMSGIDCDTVAPLNTTGNYATQFIDMKINVTYHNLNPNEDEDAVLFHAIPIMIDLFLIMIPALIAGVFFGKMGMLVGYSLMALINIINDPGFLITGFMIWSSCFILMWGDR